MEKQQGSILRPNNTYSGRLDYRTNTRKLPNLIDFNIRFQGHPKFNRRIVEVDPIEVIVQKLEILLLTNKGEVIGAPEFGADLEYMLWQTSLAAEVIESDIDRQIQEYIPELTQMGYTLEVDLFEGEIRDIMMLKFVIKGQNYRYIWQ